MHIRSGIARAKKDALINRNRHASETILKDLLWNPTRGDQIEYRVGRFSLVAGCPVFFRCRGPRRGDARPVFFLGERHKERATGQPYVSGMLITGSEGCVLTYGSISSQFSL